MQLSLLMNCPNITISSAEPMQPMVEPHSLQYQMYIFVLSMYEYVLTFSFVNMFVFLIFLSKSPSLLQPISGNLRFYLCNVSSERKCFFFLSFSFVPGKFSSNTTCPTKLHHADAKHLIYPCFVGPVLRVWILDIFTFKLWVDTQCQC